MTSGGFDTRFDQIFSNLTRWPLVVFSVEDVDKSTMSRIAAGCNMHSDKTLGTGFT